jgi:hypothetical protein
MPTLTLMIHAILSNVAVFFMDSPVSFLHVLQRAGQGQRARGVRNAEWPSLEDGNS